MIMIIMIVLLPGLIEHASSIQCYTCREPGFHCPVPFNLDGGDESNENEVDIVHFDSDYACMSDHSSDPRTGHEKIILRGIKHCKELNIPNHRVHCCYTNNCNKILPRVNIQTLADTMVERKEIESSSQRYISSIILIILSIIFQYF